MIYTIEKGVLENSSIYFHTPGNISKSIFYYLICAGHFICDHKYSVSRKNYNSYLLMYVMRGQGSVFFEGRTYTAKENEAVLIDCYKPHAYKTDSGWETVWIHFDGNASSKFFNLLFNKSGCIIPLGGSDVIPSRIHGILKAFSRRESINEPIISCDIQRMLAELLLISSGLNTGHNIQNPVSEAMAFIQNNYKQELTLNELSGMVCLSQYYFSRVFKEQTGYSPYEYVIMVRLNQAKNLLKSTDMTVKEIAFEVGFKSESNFVTCFKQHANITPSQFRAIPV